MAELLRVVRLYFVLLVIVAGGRWIMGVAGVPYARGHHIFSIVILNIYAALFYGAFLRVWRDCRLLRTVLVGVVLGLASQLLILVLTVLSYALGMDTYYNNPVAVMGPGTTEAVSFGQALISRAGGLIGNSIGAGITACLGWALGGLLPKGQ